jgi:hypothetical protein
LGALLDSSHRECGVRPRFIHAGILLARQSARGGVLSRDDSGWLKRQSALASAAIYAGLGDGTTFPKS